MGKEWGIKGEYVLNWKANAHTLLCKREKQSYLSIEEQQYLPTLPVPFMLHLYLT